MPSVLLRSHSALRYHDVVFFYQTCHVDRRAADEAFIDDVFGKLVLASSMERTGQVPLNIIGEG